MAAGDRRRRRAAQFPLRHLDVQLVAAPGLEREMRREPGTGTPRPQCSKGEWIQITFAKPSTVSEAEVYWFDDQPGGGVRVPASWRLLYQDGNDWKPVEAAGAFGVAKDAWNKVTFTPVTTPALRVEVVLPPGASAGLQELRVK
jgi:hypothetical protein